MSSKDSLYRLIKSLTQGEKTFFIKSLSRSSQDGKANYLKLFYALDQLDEFSEEKLRAKLKGASFMRHLPVIKNYLFNALLHHLKEYHQEASVKNQLQELLQDADILMRKSFYNESRKILQRAEKIALKYEYFPFCLEIYDRLLRLNYDLPPNSEAISESIAIYEKQKDALSKIASLATQRYARSLRLNIEFNVADPAEKTRLLTDLLGKELLKPGLPLPDYRSGMAYYHNLSRTYMQLSTAGARDKAYEISEAFIKFMESDADLLSVNMLSYMNALNNQFVLECELRLFDRARKTLDKLKNLHTGSEFLRFRIDERLIANVPVYYLTIRKYEEGAAYIESIEKKFLANQNQYNNQFFVCAVDNFQILYFHLGEYKKALKYTNMLLSIKNFTRPDILCFTKVFNLVLHYELGNEELIGNLVRSTRYHLEKNCSLDSYHGVIIRFFERLITLSSPGEISYEFKKLASDLNALEQTPEMKALFQLIDLREWAQSKAVGQKRSA